MARGTFSSASVSLLLLSPAFLVGCRAPPRPRAPPRALGPEADSALHLPDLTGSQRPHPRLCGRQRPWRPTPPCRRAREALPGARRSWLSARRLPSVPHPGEMTTQHGVGQLRLLLDSLRPGHPNSPTTPLPTPLLPCACPTQHTDTVAGAWAAPAVELAFPGSLTGVPGPSSTKATGEVETRRARALNSMESMTSWTSDKPRWPGEPQGRWECGGGQREASQGNP